MDTYKSLNEYNDSKNYKRTPRHDINNVEFTNTVKIDNDNSHSMISFNICSFKSQVVISTTDTLIFHSCSFASHLDFTESVKVYFINCTFKTHHNVNVFFKKEFLNSEIRYLDCVFEGAYYLSGLPTCDLVVKSLSFIGNTFCNDFEIDNVEVLNTFTLSKNTFQKNVYIHDFSSTNSSIITDNLIKENQIMILNQIKFEKFTTINFNDFNGSMILNLINIQDNSLIDVNSLINSNWLPLLLNGVDNLSETLQNKFSFLKDLDTYKISSTNFSIIRSLMIKSNNYKSDIIKCEVAYQSLNQSNLSFYKKLADKIIFSTTGYFSSVSRILLTSLIVIVSFSVINLIFFSSIDISNQSFLYKTLVSIYLSITSFTTVGFGDFTHQNIYLAILTSIEGLLGVLLTASFITTLARKYII